ncbi:DUF2827 domain-containing protein [Paraburkholderia phymatum]|uniref:DUF2827 domain-containing protein n=1 Tax=Paraburkholderia phymatum TaxID=148447 RepID=UPI00317F2CAF
MRIGISVLSHKDQSIWQNGIGQNVVFLALTLQRLRCVQSVLLIDVGSEQQLPREVSAIAPSLRIVTQREATDEVDVIVEMAGALDPQWLALMRARGRKAVFLCCGQPYVALIEPAIFGRPVYAARPERCDEVWLMPKDRAHIPLMRTLHRCPVHVVPFLWHPAFVEARVAEIEALGYRYGYDADRSARTESGSGLRVAIFEPNISVVKTASIPMLICDEAYRADRHGISAMHALNTLHMKDHSTMLHLANSLDIVKEHRATFHGRHDTVGFMAQHADAVVAHQWENDQNYSYLDVLYGDYPLIHNSPWLRDAGYYYAGFDAQDGGRQLQAAALHHHGQLDAYRSRSRTVFDAVSPFQQRNVDAYEARLQSLVCGTGFGYAA